MPRCGSGNERLIRFTFYQRCDSGSVWVFVRLCVCEYLWARVFISWPEPEPRPGPVPGPDPGLKRFYPHTNFECPEWTGWMAAGGGRVKSTPNATSKLLTRTLTVVVVGSSGYPGHSVPGPTRNELIEGQARLYISHLRTAIKTISSRLGLFFNVFTSCSESYLKLIRKALNEISLGVIVGLTDTEQSVGQCLKFYQSTNVIIQHYFRRVSGKVMGHWKRRRYRPDQLSFVRQKAREIWDMHKKYAFWTVNRLHCAYAMWDRQTKITSDFCPKSKIKSLLWTTANMGPTSITETHTKSAR